MERLSLKPGLSIAFQLQKGKLKWSVVSEMRWCEDCASGTPWENKQIVASTIANYAKKKLPILTPCTAFRLADKIFVDRGFSSWQNQLIALQSYQMAIFIFFGVCSEEKKISSKGFFLFLCIFSFLLFSLFVWFLANHNWHYFYIYFSIALMFQHYFIIIWKLFSRLYVYTYVLCIHSCEEMKIFSCKFSPIYFDLLPHVWRNWMPCQTHFYASEIQAILPWCIVRFFAFPAFTGRCIEAFNGSSDLKYWMGWGPGSGYSWPIGHGRLVPVVKGTFSRV